MPATIAAPLKKKRNKRRLFAEEDPIDVKLNGLIIIVKN